jgi:hypothetical protein
MLDSSPKPRGQAERLCCAGLTGSPQLRRQEHIRTATEKLKSFAGPDKRA